MERSSTDLHWHIDDSLFAARRKTLFEAPNYSSIRWTMQVSVPHACRTLFLPCSSTEIVQKCMSYHSCDLLTATEAKVENWASAFSWREAATLLQCASVPNGASSSRATHNAPFRFHAASMHPTCTPCLFPSYDLRTCVVAIKFAMVWTDPSRDS